ncbi:hypothetical protein W97_08886 [Coniosporium apollinis CBS 100218]|uniref:Phosphatidylinositol transfer protein SFH5 n=1 Tax=Coniosporium apollinis (strain CBS 100218) TaxID=1168221 RepID=R7Z6U4_CONA1|nr:uncharacterized protein W97_08886 [Coniosporium apollinis CBS 100218]EON69626.1 hypothetical protein W97_08886 [Coniosporium apollinis CBS 100218]
MDAQPATLASRTPTSAASTAPEPPTSNANHPAPTWPALPPDRPFSKFAAQLPEILQEAGYDEVYGIQLRPDTPFYTKLMQIFLRANANDLIRAREQLVATLKWRKEFQPSRAVEEAHSRKRIGRLGYVVEVEGVPESVTPNRKDVVTFNIYGAVKDNKATFGDLEG